MADILIEDNEDDVFLMKRALKAATILNPVQLAEDGSKAINYLSGTGQGFQLDLAGAVIAS